MPSVYCRSILTSGERCCASAMRGHHHCYFHSNLNTRHGRALRRAAAEAQETVLTPRNGAEGQLLAPPDPSFDFPALEDRTAIQLALSMLISALGRGAIQPGRATAILYGLQVASSNAARLPQPDPHALVVDTETLPDGTVIARDVDPEHLDEQDIKEFRDWLEATAPDPGPAHTPQLATLTENSLAPHNFPLPTCV
jgi:hypothetical protein